VAIVIPIDQPETILFFFGRDTIAKMPEHMLEDVDIIGIAGNM
jgi:hypothetical protein